MAKPITDKTVKFIKFTNKDDKPVDDWHKDYIGCVGILLVYESETGDNFIYFYPNEPASGMQRFFYSVPGVLSEDGNMLRFEENYKYVFEVGDFIPAEHLDELRFNIMFRR